MSSARTKVTLAGKSFVSHEDSLKGLLEIHRYARDNWLEHIAMRRATKPIGIDMWTIGDTNYFSLSDLNAKIAELSRAVVLDELRSVIEGSDE